MVADEVTAPVTVPADEPAAVDARPGSSRSRLRIVVGVLVAVAVVVILVIKQT